jgi:hypothetical protein
MKAGNSKQFLSVVRLCQRCKSRKLTAKTPAFWPPLTAGVRLPEVPCFLAWLSYNQPRKGEYQGHSVFGGLSYSPLWQDTAGEVGERWDVTLDVSPQPRGVTLPRVCRIPRPLFPLACPPRRWRCCRHLWSRHRSPRPPSASRRLSVQRAIAFCASALPWAPCSRAPTLSLGFLPSGNPPSLPPA